MLSEKPWTWDRLIRVMLAILFFVSVFFLAISAIQHYAGKDKFKDGSLPYLVLGSLGFHGSILFGTAVILGSERISWREAFGLRDRGAGRAIVLGIAAALVFLPVGMMLQEISLRLVEWLHIVPPVEPAVAEFEKANTFGSQLYLVFFAVVLAPFAEEVFFRGILYATVKQFGFPRSALWGSAIIFGAIHMTGTIFLPLVVLSLMLVWLYEKTDNLLAPITAHAVFNGINLMLMYFGDALSELFRRSFHHLR
jgi:hypothetical protein